MMIPREMLCKYDGNQSDNDGVDLLRASHCAVFGAELSKDKIVKCININLLKYKLNKKHEGISEHRSGSLVAHVSITPNHRSRDLRSMRTQCGRTWGVLKGLSMPREERKARRFPL